jgi:hypothetical protein
VLVEGRRVLPGQIEQRLRGVGDHADGAHVQESGEPLDGVEDAEQRVHGGRVDRCPLQRHQQLVCLEQGLLGLVVELAEQRHHLWVGRESSGRGRTDGRESRRGWVCRSEAGEQRWVPGWLALAAHQSGDGGEDPVLDGEHVVHHGREVVEAL